MQRMDIIPRPVRAPELIEYTEPYTGKVVKMRKAAYDAMKKTLAEFKDINEDLTEYVSLVLKDYPDMTGKLRVFKGVSEGKGLENYFNRNYLTFEILTVTYKGTDYRVYVSEFSESRNLEIILNTIINGKRIEPKTEQPAYRGITGELQSTTETTEGTTPNTRPKRGGAEKVNVADAKDIRAGFGRRKR